MDIHQRLREKLRGATERNKADAMLLSGGLDTSILAVLAQPKVAFTVGLEDSAASDLIYAQKVSELLGIENRKMEFTMGEALETLPEVIRILRTFDLALPNDLSIYFALTLARENGITSIMSGDGADELFAGYSYMAELSPQDLERYIRALSLNWHFSAGELGKALGVEVRQPFLDGDFVCFALDISPELKVREGIGKHILRRSFEGLLPAEIVWRKKEPIECGSGSAKLHEVIAEMVSDEEFQSAKERTGIAFLNKEHFFYYRIYSETVGEIPKAKGDGEGCRCCGAQLNKSHCRICGFSPPLEEFLLSLRSR